MSILVGDIGGTYCRLALVGPNGRPMEMVTWMTAAHAGLVPAVREFVKTRPTGRISAMAFCAAGPVVRSEEDTTIELTNSTWGLSARELREAFVVDDVILLNDFTALAASLPYLRDDERRLVGQGSALILDAPIGLVGPGTGLGVSGLIPDGRGEYVPLSGEGGHIDLAPSNEREQAVFQVLRKKFGHVSAERVLSGSGQEALFEAIATVDGAPCDEIPTSMDIRMRAERQDCEVSTEVIAIFTDLLGAVAGDLALTLGTLGGLYLGGGILPRWESLFNEEKFRERFEDKGRFTDYMKSIPTWMITSNDAALVGLAKTSTQRQRRGRPDAKR